MTAPLSDDSSSRCSSSSDPYGIEDTPLFATRLPEDPSSGAYGGLQSILYGTSDGSTPAEVATTLRLSGNECFRRGKRGYEDAYKFYTQAIEVGSEEGAAQDPALDAAKALAYTNRALVQLARGNNGYALQDCLAALRLNPALAKAHWHAARALLEMGRPAEALDHCEALLRDNPDDADCLKLHARCKAALERAQKQAAEAKAREEAAARQRSKLLRYGSEIDDRAAAELDRRGVRVVPPTVDLEALAAHCGAPLLVKVATENRLTLPVVLVFEEFGVTDCIADVDEAASVNDILTAVLSQDPPPPWDAHGHYRNPAAIEAFVTLADGHSLARLRPSTTLTALLAHPRYALPRFPVLQLVATESPFRAIFLEQHGLQQH